MSVKLKFLGGAKTVTGSSHLVSANSTRVLLDAGIFHGRRDEFYQVNTTFVFNPRQINALILSHAHLDHCGNIPTLIKAGLKCKIYTTQATSDLCELLLEDAGKIQEEDTKYVNKINRRLGQPMRKPLYTEADARKAIGRFRRLPYGRKYPIARHVQVTLQDAGHILGSAITVLDVKDDNGAIRIGYAVDLGRKGLPLLNDPAVPQGLDYLILESTYGGRNHDPIEQARKELKEAVNRTISRGGKVLIPSFALERTQEVVYYLNELFRQKEIPLVPVYVDSPLAVNITDVFKKHIDYLDKDTKEAMKYRLSPFDSINLHYIHDQRDSKKLNHDKHPMIIIAGSGMCEAGRILHHLRNNVEDSRNMILVVGYMAQNTLGRKIVERHKYVRIFGVEQQLNAEVEIINAFSGHADQNELCQFVMATKLKCRVFLVHGEEAQSQVLCNKLLSMKIDAVIPDKNEEVTL